MKKSSGRSEGVEGSTREAPRVAWNRLSARKAASDGHPDCLYRASLAMPDGQEEPVDVYTSPNPHQEVLAMQQLDGLIGVPRVHGVTEPAPEALVINSCQGSTLRAWLAEGNVFTCLSAFLNVCTTLSRMHSMGVTHGDLTLHNILVNVQNNDQVEVFLVGFHSAHQHATQEDIKADEKHLQSLATVIVLSLNKDSDSDFYQRRGQLLRHNDKHLTLVEIGLLVCGVLYNHPEAGR